MLIVLVENRAKPHHLAKKEVAILGAGIMGSSIALFLVRQGIRVKLFDMNERPFSGASRWNEGKIHLGYLYSADTSLRTAKKLIPGGIMFPHLVEQLVGIKFTEDMITPVDDRYLIHRDSVVKSDQFESYIHKISKIGIEHPEAQNYFVPLHKVKPRRLDFKSYKHECNTEFIDAAFEVPERSVRTTALADNFIEALYGQPELELLMQYKVESVSKLPKNKGWCVEVTDPAGFKTSFSGFGAVVNALWEGRPAIDATIGIPGPGRWTHRYRLSVFAKTKVDTSIRSAVIAVGPFGDIKNYDGSHLYLSWYQAGLMAESHELQPPEIKLPSPAHIARTAELTIQNLAEFIPELNTESQKIASYEVKGGWVYAAGAGPLDDPNSELHTRFRIGQYNRQGYFSVDTGKYSVAPLMALEVSKAILEQL